MKTWLKNLFAKKEPIKTWSDFDIRSACKECETVLFDRMIRRCCPKCGSLESKQVVARRLTSVSNFDIGISPMIIQHDVEIKGDV
jgi:Zn finger protein HypA/HybF involved in hydrogenase expression